MAVTYVDAKVDDCSRNSHGYDPREASQTTLQRCSLMGGRHIASGNVDSGVYLSNEFAERYLTGRVPVGAGCPCVVPATHVCLQHIQ
eukprot:7474786-Pyramimonas_sp.AAC.1